MLIESILKKYILIVVDDQPKGDHPNALDINKHKFASIFNN